MLLIAGCSVAPPAVLDQLASSSSPAYADALATYGRTLQQRNSLLRAMRDGASRDELRFWDGAFLDAGATIVAERRRLLGVIARAAARTRRDRPGGSRLPVG
jgi:recombinational DNA repair ATPase RecF